MKPQEAESPLGTEKRLRGVKEECRQSVPVSRAVITLCSVGGVGRSNCDVDTLERTNRTFRAVI